VCKRLLTAPAATETIHGFRSNPRWRIVDVVPGSSIMTQLWQRAAARSFVYGRIFDLRLGLTLRHHGVTEFATCNAKDFADLGFERVWNPLR